MSRNQLHKTRLDEFLTWCVEVKGLGARRVNLPYQVAQIRPKYSNNWMSIYFRDHMPEHYTVDRRLDPLVKNFIRSTKCRSQT